MSTNAKKHYPPDAGAFISLKDADRMINKYGDHERERTNGQEDFTRAYFFGKEKIKQLLECDGCVGIRIYYGMDTDKDGKDNKKMVLYPVDKDGKNMPYRAPRPKISGLGFAPQDDPDDGTALDGGLECPSYCP